MVRERPLEDGPTRRVVYERHAVPGHYERREQLWRQSIGDWHTVGTELVADVTIERPEER
ncbi:hypothetical protein DQW50_16220 [Halorubrum sp. 48-1-W]|nr:hypothetical protein DQW50_16220 [Halorubrum sp. 48-1-W]